MIFYYIQGHQKIQNDLLVIKWNYMNLFSYIIMQNGQWQGASLMLAPVKQN